MLLVAALAGSVALAPCENRRGLELFLETDKVAATDSVARVYLCLSGVGGSVRANSLSARITIDTAFGRFTTAAPPSGAPMVARVDSAKATVLVAGASASGIPGGQLLALGVHLARPGVLPRLTLVLTEMNDAAGVSMVTRVAAESADARCVGNRPALFQVLPPSASADPGEPLDLRIDGCGFSADKNTIMFGDLTVRNVKSTDGGTHIRVTIPKTLPARGEAAPMIFAAGAYDVIVDNGRGETTNAKRVTLR